MELERLRLCRKDRQEIRVYAGRRMPRRALPLRGGKQPVVLLSYHAIALAHRPLQGFAVDDRDTAAGVVDDSRRLELAGRFGDAAARDAEHVGNELLRHQELVRLQTIEAEQQPPA